MFAYCTNNPANCFDLTGNCACTSVGGLNNHRVYSTMCPCGGSSAGGGALLLPGLVDAIDEATTGILLAVSYVYRQYTQSIKASTYGMQPGNYPVTHHIVPYGKYTTRSDRVQEQLRQAQDIMTRAGVIPMTDPINQLILSATYHVSLHTDSYIAMVTAPIIALGENATKEQIYGVLDDLRTIVAYGDQYTWGY